MYTNYLKINDDVFTLKKVNKKNIDINKELREFYSKKINDLEQSYKIKERSLKDSLNDICKNSIVKDWSGQLKHLNKYKTGMEIPTELIEEPVIYHKGVLMELRFIVYAPTEVLTTMDFLRTCDDVDFHNGLFNDIPNNSTVNVTVKPVFHVPLLLAYNRINTIFSIGQKTYHTMGEGNLCLGNHYAKDYWKLNDKDFSEQINKINAFSPATYSIPIGETHYRIKTEILNKDTILKVIPKGANTWSLQ